jgi:hypothetical protein
MDLCHGLHLVQRIETIIHVQGASAWVVLHQYCTHRMYINCSAALDQHRWMTYLLEYYHGTLYLKLKSTVAVAVAVHHGTESEMMDHIETNNMRVYPPASLHHRLVRRLLSPHASGWVVRRERGPTWQGQPLRRSPSSTHSW